MKKIEGVYSRLRRDKSMKTPYYLIHKNMLDKGITHLRQALKEYWPNALIGYSFKTNSLPWILSHMKKQGCLAEVVSQDEYELAEYIGFEKIIYNGPVKEKESFLRACRAGHMVNLDAEQEVEWVKEAAQDGPVKVGVRVNFDLEAMCPGEASGGTEGGRFGFSYEKGGFRAVLEKLRAVPGVTVAGIHLHCSSRTRSLRVYQAVAKTACQIRREYNLELEYVDTGGGYFGGLADKPQYEDYLRVMSDILKTEYNPQKTMLVVEPGTSLICPPVEYVTTVIDVKETNRNHFVVTDGSRIHVDPLMTKSSYFYHIEPLDAKVAGVMAEKQILTGFTCMENDRLFALEGGRKLMKGDRIVYEKVGAYTMCLSPLFSEYYPAVYLEDNGTISCVRRKWGVQEYVQQSLLEEAKNEYSDIELWNKKQDRTIRKKGACRAGQSSGDGYESQRASAL